GSRQAVGEGDRRSSDAPGGALQGYAERMACETHRLGAAASGEGELRDVGTNERHRAFLVWIPDRGAGPAGQIPVGGIEAGPPVQPAVGVEPIRVGPTGLGGGGRDWIGRRVRDRGSDDGAECKRQLEAAGERSGLDEEGPTADGSVVQDKNEVVLGQ